MMDGTAGEIRYPFAEPPAPGAAVQVAEGVLWLRMPLPMALDHVNLYALDDGEMGWTLIDAGMMWSRGREALAAALEGPLGGRPVHRVIVTHHHPDHIGLAGWFQSERGAELWTTRTAWLFARMLVLDPQPRPVPEQLAFWRDAGMDPAILAQKLQDRPFNFADIVAPLPPGFRRIADGDHLTAGGREWIVRTGNGHAPEQATLWEADGDLVIGGDQLLPSISPNLGVFPNEPDADPVAEWIASCARLRDFATDAQLVLPGHKLPFTGLPMRLGQKIDNHLGALDRLRGLLGQPRTAAGCFPALFRREIGPAEYILALGESVAHLNHLLHRGEALRERRDDGAWLWRLA